MIFIITILLLAADFYYLKNIAGRRLVGLRWWNEVDPATGESHWVFESSEPGTKVVNATDSRFFWIAIYAQPLFWIALALVAVLTLKFIWLPLVGASSHFPSRRETRGESESDVVKKGCWADVTGGICCFSAIALVLTITNSLAFSRCDKFSQASNLAGSAFSSGNLAGSIASNMVGRFFSR
jgi:hypothetical protein